MKFILSEMERVRVMRSKKGPTFLGHDCSVSPVKWVCAWGSRDVQSRSLLSGYAVLVSEWFLGGTLNIYSPELLGKLAGTSKMHKELGTSYWTRK